MNAEKCTVERMDRFAGVLLLLCVVVGISIGTKSVAHAEKGEREKVALFVVADGPADLRRAQQAATEVQDRLVKQGKEVVRPDFVISADQDVGMSGARLVGRSAFSDLAEGKAPDDVLKRYGGAIIAALENVSAVHDPEGRSLLWNLCALRIHLLLLTGGDEGPTRAAVQDCSRRFVDRPNFGKAWLEEVVRTFERFTTGLRQVQISVKTAPGGCDLRVYGATVGMTPIVLDLSPGRYEIQIACAGREGGLHAVDIQEGRDLVIRLEADQALAVNEGVAWLNYRGGVNAAQVLDDAGALTSEAGARSFVLLRADGPEVDIQWMRPPGTLLGESRVSPSGTAASRARRIAELFEPTRDRDERVSRPRTWADYSLGFGLVAAGAALATYPLLAISRDGRCADSSCSSVYDGRGWKASIMLTAAGALAASGLAVVWVGPFGKRQTVSVANGLMISGSF